MLIPLALAQFICSFAGSNMNVMINDISRDLDTTVKVVQTAITVFLLVMALMIPGGKLSDAGVTSSTCYASKPPITTASALTADSRCSHPTRQAPIGQPSRGEIKRRDRLGRLIHEYHRAAA